MMAHKEIGIEGDGELIAQEKAPNISQIPATPQVKGDTENEESQQ